MRSAPVSRKSDQNMFKISKPSYIRLGNLLMSDIVRVAWLVLVDNTR